MLTAELYKITDRTCYAARISSPFLHYSLPVSVFIFDTDVIFSELKIKSKTNRYRNIIIEWSPPSLKRVIHILMQHAEPVFIFLDWTDNISGWITCIRFRRVLDYYVNWVLGSRFHRCVSSCFSSHNQKEFCELESCRLVYGFWPSPDSQLYTTILCCSAVYITKAITFSPEQT